MYIYSMATTSFIENSMPDIYTHNFKTVRTVELVCTDALTLSDNFPMFREKSFSDVRIYGTRETPLFVANDVKKILEIEDMNIRHNKNLLVGVHHAMVILADGQNTAETMVLTASGLYIIMYNSRVDLAREFESFVFVILRSLRTHGHASVDRAMADLASLRLETDMRRGVNDRFEQRTRNLQLQTDILNSENFFLDARVHRARERTATDLQTQVLDMLQRVGTAVYICSMKPPSALACLVDDDHDYKLPCDDDTTTFIGVFDRPRSNRESILVLHVEKPNNAATVRDWLKSKTTFPFGQVTVPVNETDPYVIGSDHKKPVHDNLFYMSARELVDMWLYHQSTQPGKSC